MQKFQPIIQKRLVIIIHLACRKITLYFWKCHIDLICSKCSSEIRQRFVLTVRDVLMIDRFKEAPADTMEWHPDLPSMIKIVDKKTKENLEIKLNTKGMGIFHFGNAFEVVADGITFIVWDGCPNYYSNGATHLFNIDTLRSSVEDVQAAVSYLI